MKLFAELAVELIYSLLLSSLWSRFRTRKGVDSKPAMESVATLADEPIQ